MNSHGVETNGGESGHVSRMDLSSPWRVASAPWQAGFLLLQPLVFAEGEVGAGKCSGAAGDALLSSSSPGRLLIAQPHGSVGQGMLRESKMFPFSYEMKPHKIKLTRVMVFMHLAARQETSGQSFCGCHSRWQVTGALP